MTEHTEVILFLFVAVLLFVGLSLASTTKSTLPSTATCFDPDGSSTSIRSYVTFTNGSVTQRYNDGCVNNYTVREYICLSNSARSQSIACAGGYYCNDGLCSRIATPTPRPSCFDSDGSNSMVRGYVNVTTGSSMLRFNDGCFNNMTVREFVCNGASYGNLSIGCSIGYRCNDGMCSR